ncbi:MAG TPA: hypothetical protein VK155_18850 [Bacteroidales bacterium]|nr:hypothetical protein [Bacteroidales bacterium]
MRRTGKTLAALMLLLPFALLSCKNSEDGIIVVTRQTGTYIDTISPENDLYPSSIGLIKPGKEGITILTGDFFAACSPDISFDANYLLFAGRKTKDSPWQIWEMKLKNGKTKEVTPATETCIDPAWLPGDRLVYSRLLVNDSLKSHLSLFTCNRDGSGNERITFTPSSYNSSTVLADGRILAICRKDYPVNGKPEMIVLRPDGTKAELFFKSPGLYSMRPHETASSEIVFTEKANSTGKMLVSRVNYNVPLHSKSLIFKDITGDFISAVPYNNKWLVCSRKQSAERFSVSEYDEKGGSLIQIYSDDGTDVVYAIRASARPVPRKLPSEVDKLVKTGLLLCQDITVNGQSLDSGERKTMQIEITGIDASYGRVQPESDGSIYMKIIADMPFRISTLDENGHVIRTCNWMSLRPNERRGCSGCHEDSETVPENRLPLAVRQAPAIIPVHVEKITEKIVELE